MKDEFEVVDTEDARPRLRLLRKSEKPKGFAPEECDEAFREAAERRAYYEKVIAENERREALREKVARKLLEDRTNFAWAFDFLFVLLVLAGLFATDDSLFELSSKSVFIIGSAIIAAIIAGIVNKSGLGQSFEDVPSGDPEAGARTARRLFDIAMILTHPVHVVYPVSPWRDGGRGFRREECDARSGREDAGRSRRVGK